MLKLVRDVLNWIKRFLKWESAAPSEPKSPAEPAGTQPTAPSLPPVQTPPLPTAAYQLELNAHSPDPARYELWYSILTRQEHLFFKSLLQAVGDEFQVFAKVRLADIFKLASEPADRKYHSNQIQCKHFDFLICLKESCKPLLAIELDDGSHKKLEHQERDDFKNKICRQTGLHLLRFELKDGYQPGFIKEKVHSKLQAK